MAEPALALDHWLEEASRVWLFLDYDGTLADFSRTPDLVEAREEVIQLVRRLAAQPRLRVGVISGRTLQIIRALLPVEGVFLAGTYGLEMLPPSGPVLYRENLSRIRPTLDQVKPRWEELISGKEGFFLEDKGWTLAIHAGRAERRLAESVLSTAKKIASAGLPEGVFRWFEDAIFLELAPRQAHKGKAVGYLYGHYPFPEARLIYIGDDDKDEEAFQTVHAFGGVNILVSSSQHPLHSGEVDYIIETPSAVRGWLRRNFLDEQS